MSVRDLTILGSSSQQPTRRRNHGAYLLRWNGEGFLFDPGEGTQRQFIFANIAPTCVTRIFVSHFHGDHCLGLGSMLMRLNLDHVTHEVHCYYPASGKVFFDRLRWGTAYHERIKVIEHPVREEGIIEQGEQFTIEAYYLDHGIDNLGWRIREKNTLKFYPEKLRHYKIEGLAMKELLKRGYHLLEDGRRLPIAEVSYERKGTVFAMVSDTRPCLGALKTACEASLLLCESTYLDEHKKLAHEHYHLTASQAAMIAKEAGSKKLILTHFSARYADLRPFIQEAQKLFPDVDVAEDLKVFPFSHE